ncbi:DedA family protein [Cellulomonas soli]|uniref:DedA family protein n=1 Tax=Cellulomonas soli TaxID=931535 RepID=UPI003F825E8B
MTLIEAWALALAGSPWVFLVVYLFATIDGFFPPIPSESVIIAFAALAMSGGDPPLLPLMLAAAAGAFTGDQIAYQIGTKVDVRRVRFLRRPAAQRTIDWAERALARRGASFIIAARYIPVGRVAVNMTAGALGFRRRRFVFLTALAAVTWAGYSTAIGVGAGLWLHDHPVVAVAAGVVGGVLIGLLVDWMLRRWMPMSPAIEPHTATEPAHQGRRPGDAPAAVQAASSAAPVTGRSRSASAR